MNGGDNGRRSKLALDPAIQTEVCDRLARGHSVATAAPVIAAVAWVKVGTFVWRAVRERRGAGAGAAEHTE